ISNLNGDNPNFEENWQNLLAIRQAWNTDGSAPVPQHESLSDESYLHELWHTAAKLQSQPLRPVDDARFVFIRLGNPAMEVLAEVAMDEHRYVRDHALQTFNWMSRQHNHISNSDLILLGQDYYTSVRSIEYRGSLRSPTQAEYLWPFIWHGNYEQRTAAADSLLRCSDTDATNINQLDFSTGFSPEAQCSLSLLRDELNGNEIVEPQIQGLDKNELARRMRWRLSRD
ncbi:MAG: hypothetical protein QGF46_02535, partial [Planctomycetota bacterium]|nr:hypothetical protein [Planctomycetota bacterium]